jgi:hypothetical protein
MQETKRALEEAQVLLEKVRDKLRSFDEEVEYPDSASTKMTWDQVRVLVGELLELRSTAISYKIARSIQHTYPSLGSTKCSFKNVGPTSMTIFVTYDEKDLKRSRREKRRGNDDEL